LARTHNDVTNRRPTAEVFAVLCDVEKEPLWSLHTVEERMLTPGPMRVGSRRRAVIRAFGGRTWVNQAEMVVFEPNRRMEIRIEQWAMTANLSIDFLGADGGTRLDWNTTFSLPTLLRPFGPMLAAAYRRQMQEDLDNLKAMMESGRL
jgi:Polyketide cyclase / dehydrase and lipid transport